MFKFFTSDLRRNLTKILCLTVGLSVGFLLIAKIFFDQTYDAFFPEINRIYRVAQGATSHGKYDEWFQTPGGTAPELRRTFPQVELATRFTYLSYGNGIKLEDERIFETEGVVLADSCLFDILQTPIIAGDPHEVLTVKNMVMIPRSLADKIGGDVIGRQISNTAWSDDIKLTIGGVYEDFPLNSSIDNYVWLSMPSIGQFTYDGSENLLGNDRYTSFVKLTPGTNPDDLHPKILEHLKTKLPEETFRISDYKVWLRPFAGSYANIPAVKKSALMLGMLAIVLLMCAGLNYLLIVIGQLAARGKEMAIRKCYGTGERKLFLRVMGESIFFLLVSLGLAVLLAYSLSDLCKELLGYTTRQLFSTRNVWVVEGSVCLLLLIITGVIPSVIYSRTPVAQAFRPSVRSRKGWKLALLALQFFSTGLILCLLVLTGRQYVLLGNIKLGYDYENIGIFYFNGVQPDRAATIMEELRKLPSVENVATSETSISGGASGNMFWTEGHEDDQINVADLYEINPELLQVLGLKLIQGRNFNQPTDTAVNEVIVERRMIDVLKNVFGEPDDDIIGTQFHITGHGYNGDFYTIVGVIEDTHRGGFQTGSMDTRPGVFFPSSTPRPVAFVRFSELTPETLKEAQGVINSLKDSNEVYITPFKAYIDAKRSPVKQFGTSVMVVGIAIILIALIGLIGYVADEVNRRAKEIAIRKVNGTSAASIVHLFCIDILRVALPSLLAGGAVAIVVGQKWLAQYTERVSLSPLSMLLCLFVLSVIITGVVILNSLRVARSNPVEHLRSE